MKNFLTSKLSIFMYGSAVGSVAMFLYFAAEMQKGFYFTLQNGKEYWCLWIK